MEALSFEPCYPHQVFAIIDSLHFLWFVRFVRLGPVLQQSPYCSYPYKNQHPALFGAPIHRRQESVEKQKGDSRHAMVIDYDTADSLHQLMISPLRSKESSIEVLLKRVSTYSTGSPLFSFTLMLLTRRRGVVFEISRI